MAIKCSGCINLAYRLETKQEKTDPYCRQTCQSLQPNEEYQECKLFLDSNEARQWKPRT